MFHPFYNFKAGNDPQNNILLFPNIGLGLAEEKFLQKL